MTGSPSGGIDEIYLGDMVNFAWTAATSFSIIALKAGTWLGVIVTVVGLGEAIHALLAKFFHWYVVPGWTSLTVLISIHGGCHIGQHRRAWRVRGKVIRTDEEPPTLPSVADR